MKKELIIIGAIIIIAVLIITHKPRDYTYNGFPFYRDNQGFWHTVIYLNKSIPITMYFHPSQVQSIPLDPLVISVLSNSSVNKFYIAAPPESSSLRAISMIELQKIIGNIYHKPALLGVTHPYGNKSLLVINCSNATSSTPVILLLRYNSTAIIHNGYCIYVLGVNDEAILKAVNKLDYVVLGIIPWSTTTQRTQNQA